LARISKQTIQPIALRAMFNEPFMNLRFAAAMLTYAVLATLAGFTLTGNIRIATWIFLGGIALKTCVVVLKRRTD